MQGSKAIKLKAKTEAKKPRKSNTVSNVATQDPTKPIPFENGNIAYSYSNNSDYLPFLPGYNDAGDNYAQLLLESRLLSVTHNSCIVTKRDYCAGDGFVDKQDTELSQEIMDWLGNMNLDNEDISDLNKKIFEDLFTWGNVPIELVRFKVGGTPKLFVYVHNVLDWRLGAPDDDDRVNNAIQSKLFRRCGFLTSDDLKKSKNLPLYSPNKTDKDNWLRDTAKGVERTLIWYKNRVSGFDFYGLPSAIAALMHQTLEYKGARYNLDNFLNNLVAATLLVLKGSHSQPEADRIARKIISAHTGDGKRGRTIVLASEEGIEGSNVQKMETKTDGSFTLADEKWSQKIIMANQWDSILAGIVSASTLGKGAGFLTKIIEQKMLSVIRPAQRDLMDKVWRHVFAIADQWLGLGFDQYELEINNPIDISGLTDVDITPAVQINEVRKAKGLPEDPAMEGVYMKAAAPQAEADPNKEKGGPEDV